MAVTIEKEPANPLLSKNEIAWKVSTDREYADTRIIGHLFVEDSPYSDTWSFVKKQAVTPDPDDGYAGWFFIQDVMDRILQYTAPQDGSSVRIDSKVCRRIKWEFYDQRPSDLDLLYEFFTTDSPHALVEYDALSGQQSYLFRLYYSATSDKSLLKIGIGTNTSTDPDTVNVSQVFSPCWTLGSDFGQYADNHYYNASAGTWANRAEVPANCKLEIYEWNRPTTRPISTVRHVLKAGMSPLLFAGVTADADYWVDDNLDNVIDDNGNLIIV